ncbi:hypothetical protein O6P43_031193 [Quillaja saponaria]|uniref:Uncharacterized protein n=1 Tax=Quillaja saponaria TaxID=32244 RepID=A0AAD7KUX8_QUISA|nr:hypothetical protein O6P43_031193 [Quillaja saponaria]
MASFVASFLSAPPLDAWFTTICMVSSNNCMQRFGSDTAPVLLSKTIGDSCTVEKKNRLDCGISATEKKSTNHVAGVVLAGGGVVEIINRGWHLKKGKKVIH